MIAATGTLTTTREQMLAQARAIELEWTCAAAALLPATKRLDAHTHLGLDTDGSQISLAELLGEMDDAAIDFALTTALHHPEGYDDANREVLDWVAQSGGRLLPLWRCDPHRDDAAADAARGFAAGAVGVKLHPRAEAFRMDCAGVSALSKVVAEHRGVVLIHAGRGMRALGEQVLQLAVEHPDATYILAHAAVSDLSWVVEAAADVPNLVFDSSWWSPIDIAALLSTAHPSRVVFGSDPPYGTVAFGVMGAARVARSVGWGDLELQALFGGTLARLLGDRAPAGVEAIAADRLSAPSATPASIEPHSWAFRRCASYLTATVAVAISQASPHEQLELAMRALEVPADHPEHGAAQQVAQVLAVAEQAFLHDEPRTGLMTTVIALTHVATPGLQITPVVLPDL